MLVLTVAVAACASPVPAPSAPLPLPQPTTAASAVASPSAILPPTAPLLADRLDCDGPRPSLPPEALGSALFDHVEDLTIDGAFAHFLDVEGDTVGVLPTSGWRVSERASSSATFEHLVGDRAKAIAFFAATPEASEMRWTWAVAACDPSEFDASSPVTGGAIVWTDRTGARVPLDRVSERSPCGGPATFLAVDRHAYSLRGGYPRERLVGSFAGDVTVPEDARATGYRNGDRLLWIGADGRAAYVGTRDHAQRLPRIRHDDTSVTDCN